VSADEAPAERLHPLALLSGLGKAARNLVGALFAGGYFAFQGRPFVALLILGILGVAIFGGLFLNWLTFSFRVGEDSVRIDSGILSRNHRTIPFDRVQDVSIAQGPLQRLVGVAQVTLETGGSSLLQEEGVLAAVALSRAEALRDLVRARRMGLAPDHGEDAAGSHEVEEAPVFTMDLKRVLTCGLFNFSLAVLAALFGASQTVGDVVGVDPFERDFWRPILLDNGLGQYLLDHRLGLAIGGIVVLVLLGVATGLVRTLLREYGFRLDRTPKGLRRRRGLTTRTDVSLPKKRIQAGVIGTGPVRDWFGWRAFSVQSLAGDRAEGGGGGLKGDHVLAPLAREQEIAPIVAELGWALPDERTGWRPVAKAHVWSFLALLVPFLLLLVGAGTALVLASERKNLTDGADGLVAGALLPATLGLAAFSLLAALRWLEWRRTAFAVEGERLLIRTGWWSRRTLILPLANVQSADLRETALSRRFGVAHVIVDIAGGSALGNVVPSLLRKEASLLRRELLSLQP
jgi:putative membrane protein